MNATGIFVLNHPDKLYWMELRGNHRLCIARPLISGVITRVFDLKHVMHASCKAALWHGLDAFHCSTQILHCLVQTISRANDVNAGFSIEYQYRLFEQKIQNHYPEISKQLRNRKMAISNEPMTLLRMHDFSLKVYNVPAGRKALGGESEKEVAISRADSSRFDFRNW